MSPDKQSDMPPQLLDAAVGSLLLLVQLLCVQRILYFVLMCCLWFSCCMVLCVPSGMCVNVVWHDVCDCVRVVVCVCLCVFMCFCVYV